jgi:hypothetical protein
VGFLQRYECFLQALISKGFATQIKATEAGCSLCTSPQCVHPIHFIRRSGADKMFKKIITITSTEKTRWVANSTEGCCNSRTIGLSSNQLSNDNISVDIALLATCQYMRRDSDQLSVSKMTNETTWF